MRLKDITSKNDKIKFKKACDMLEELVDKYGQTILTTIKKPGSIASIVYNKVSVPMVKKKKTAFKNKIKAYKEYFQS